MQLLFVHWLRKRMIQSTNCTQPFYSSTLYGDFRRNYKKAFEWMETAANQGNTDAEVEMAEMYVSW